MSDSRHPSKLIDPLEPFGEPQPSLLTLCWLQHSDPIAFLRQVAQHGGWRRVGLASFGGTIGVMMLLTLLAYLNQSLWREIMAYALLAIIPLAASIILPVVFSHHNRFWLTYLLSWPWLLIVLLCGLLPLTSATNLGTLPYLLMGSLLIPAAIGATVAVAGSVWVIKCLRQAEREMEREQVGKHAGLAAKLPQLDWWNRVRLLRIGLAVMSVLGGTLLLLLYPRESLPVALMAFVFGAACLRLEATLLSCFSPLLTVDAETGGWRTTYSSRFALFVPQRKLDWLLARGEGHEAAAIILTLLRSSTLAPAVRRACTTPSVSAAQAHRLLLHLSLQTGGATAIRYIQPALPLSLRPVSERYATLASEATKPSHLQLWLRCLPEQVQTKAQTQAQTATLDRHEPANIGLLLSQVREALLRNEWSAQVDAASGDLQQLIKSLYGASQPAKACWPVVLLRHLESHRRRLKVEHE